MPRFNSWMRCAWLLSGLLSFAHTSSALAEAANAAIGNGLKSPPAEQRVALVIGNSNYQSAPPLTNPNNDARSVAQLLNTAGFEVTVATDQTRTDMVRGLQDFSNKVAAPVEPPIQLAAQPAVTTPDPALEISLGSSIIARGIVRRPVVAANDPLAPIRRMSQAEKIAFFS